MMTEKRSSEIFGGTFLIGLALLFLFNWWWPGILFVIGIALLVRAVAAGRSWTDERGGLVLLVVGVLFLLTDVVNIFSFNWLPVALILVGLYMLFGGRLRGGSTHRDDSV
jgi:hypothetical protein